MDLGSVQNPDDYEVQVVISTLLLAASSLGFIWRVLEGTDGASRFPNPRDKSCLLLLHTGTREEFLLAVVLWVEVGSKQCSFTFKTSNRELCRSLSFLGTASWSQGALHRWVTRAPWPGVS